MDVQASLNITQPPSSFASPSPAVAPTPSTNPPPPLPAHPPTSEEIDAVIRQATSTVSLDGRHFPFKDTRTQLFVGNLPYRVRWQDLKDLFHKAGTVLRADVPLGPDNRSRGHGTVLLATAEDARRAVEIFNGYSWHSRVLEVRLGRLPSDFDNFSNPVSGYHSPTLVNTHAPIIPGLRPPYPFPTAFPPPINSSLSTSFVPRIPLRGTLDESYANNSNAFGHDWSSTVGGISRSLFVGNLPFHCQWKDLKDLFHQAGTILRADVALGQDGRSRGFGTVVFATEHDAKRAVNMFNGYEYNGRLLEVHSDKFMPSVGRSLTAPSPPLITSPFAGINTTFDVFPSLLRSQPHAILSHLGTAPEQQVPTHMLTNPGLPDPIDTVPSLRNDPPSVSIADLPTPPPSSADISSTNGPRVSSPPLHVFLPIQKQDLTSHPPTHTHDAMSIPVPFTASTSSIYPELSHSSQIFVSSSQRETVSRLEKTSSPPRQRMRTHTAHPGPISLPPSSAFVVPAAHNSSLISPLQQSGVVPFPSSHARPHSPPNRPMFLHAWSPLQQPAYPPSLYMTPSGLPPITPSMPYFQFDADPLARAFLPVSTMSPGAFWGRPERNPLTNAISSVPVMKGQSQDEFDYFSCASTDISKEESYFSLIGSSLVDGASRKAPGSTSSVGE